MQEKQMKTIGTGSDFGWGVEVVVRGGEVEDNGIAQILLWSSALCQVRLGFTQIPV